MPYFLRAAGYPGASGGVVAHGRGQAPEAGALFRLILLHSGVQYQGLLHGRHAGRLQGKPGMEIDGGWGIHRLTWVDDGRIEGWMDGFEPSDSLVR